MLEKLAKPAPDKIIALMDAFRADTRTDKIDLGVGVYKTPDGRTPVMRAIKAAEKQLLAEQTSKSYVGLRGDLGFVDTLAEMIFGAEMPRARIAGAQTPGGTGAVRQLMAIYAQANPDGTLWMSDPTWPNHPAIAKSLGLPIKTHAYLRADRPEVDFDAMMGALGAAKPGDTLLLHGCCHNPTGANLTLDEWRTLTAFVVERGLLPFIDFAYQGFGDGLAEDAAGVRHMMGHVPEMLVAASCSKNFGVYRDRVGAMYAMTEATDLAGAAMASVNRLNFSFPPDHGAKAVAMVLDDAELRADWATELEEMRLAMLATREGLADALRRESNSDRFDFVARHRGMFSRLGLSTDQVMTLRKEHGIYMVDDSRINIAGLGPDAVDKLARSVASVI